MNRIAILGTGDADMPDASTPLPILDAAREFRPELFTVPGAVFPDSPRARETCALAYLEAGLTAETNGYAGLYINTVGDYGLQELRKASTIPVSGAGEGAILTATGAKKKICFCDHLATCTEIYLRCNSGRDGFRGFLSCSSSFIR